MVPCKLSSICNTCDVIDKVNLPPTFLLYIIGDHEWLLDLCFILSDQVLDKVQQISGSGCDLHASLATLRLWCGGHFSLGWQTNKPFVIHPDFHRPSRHACFYFIIWCMHEKFNIMTTNNHCISNLIPWAASVCIMYIMHENKHI